MDADAAVLHRRSSQVVRWKASDQDHAAIRTAGGAAQRPSQLIAEKTQKLADRDCFLVGSTVA